MEFIISTLKFVVTLLVVFYPVQIILKIINEKFNIFTPLQEFIKKSGNEKPIDKFVFIISIVLFLLIGSYINLNDLQFGIIAGAYYAVLFTIFPWH
ncbi:hypothetical protein KPL37_14160 [Clostridium frigoris]|uniref:Branched-chain amino acid transport protein (AzlD) n=1 Tax=Clostridium frigoris TaxID=205327 RepID=A0ABS6BVD0_9CLOT|nr:hypothetical protein [Clostridium frigoris]MBU3160886.1 hypothetical protein [Clostridium frigoris]